MSFESRPRAAFPFLVAAAFSLTCFAYAWRFGEYSCKTFSFLWEENGYTEGFAERVELTMIVSLCVSAFFIWIPRLRWVALAGAGVMISEMLSETLMPSAKYPMLYWAEWALRYSSPLVVLCLYQDSAQLRRWGEWLMRIAIVLTFAGHGIKAYYADPQFIDFILATCRRLGLDLGEDAAVWLLRVIGTVDLFFATHLLLRKWSKNLKILYGIAAWGAITAFSRITYGGTGNWHEVLIRSTHFLVPIALLWRYRVRLKKSS